VITCKFCNFHVLSFSCRLGEEGKIKIVDERHSLKVSRADYLQQLIDRGVPEKDRPSLSQLQKWEQDPRFNRKLRAEAALKAIVASAASTVASAAGAASESLAPGAASESSAAGAASDGSASAAASGCTDDLKSKYEVLMEKYEALLKKNDETTEKLLVTEQQLLEAREQIYQGNLKRSALLNQVLNFQGKIRVFARARPPLASEKMKQLCGLSFPDETSLLIWSKKSGSHDKLKKKFAFQRERYAGKHIRQCVASYPVSS
jgi:Microtubule binding